MQSKLQIYHTKNEKALRFIFRVTAIFTIIGYGSDTPRSFIEGEYYNVCLNVFMMTICALAVFLNAIKKLNVRWAAGVTCYSQLLVSILTISILINSQSFSEITYAIEVVLHMIYIAVMGFIIGPKHSLYYGGVAFFMNILLLILFLGKGPYDMLPLFTSIIPGFTIGMYHFSKSSVRSYADSYLRAGIIEDQKEEIVQLGQFRQDMTNMVVHDLKNPLSILLNIELIEDEKKRAEIVKYSGYKMMNLVQNMLDVSKYEMAEIKLDAKEVKALAVFNLAKNELEYFAKDKSLVFEISTMNDCTIIADSDILLRIFSNILSNSIKFSPNKGVITFKSELVDNAMQRFSIHNQGRHIPKEKQDLIFERYGQAERKSTGKLQSTGLGLTFCKMAVEAHGGQIGVISEDGQGAEFWFTMPASVVNTSTVDKSSSQSKPLSATHKEYLKPFVKELNKKKIFEVSQLLQIISKIDKSEPSIKQWTKTLENLIYSGNSDAFSNFINKI